MDATTIQDNSDARATITGESTPKVIAPAWSPPQFDQQQRDVSGSHESICIRNVRLTGPAPANEVEAMIISNLRLFDIPASHHPQVIADHRSFGLRYRLMREEWSGCDTILRLIREAIEYHRELVRDREGGPTQHPVERPNPLTAEEIERFSSLIDKEDGEVAVTVYTSALIFARAMADWSGTRDGSAEANSFFRPPSVRY